MQQSTLLRRNACGELNVVIFFAQHGISIVGGPGGVGRICCHLQVVILDVSFNVVFVLKEISLDN
jgi:hypothetical protein